MKVLKFALWSLLVLVGVFSSVSVGMDIAEHYDSAFAGVSTGAVHFIGMLVVAYIFVTSWLYLITDLVKKVSCAVKRLR